jgi:hypothetical protein
MVDEGRLEVQLAEASGLVKTREGLMVDPAARGEKNRESLRNMKSLASTASTADIIEALNELLSELKRTKNMRGGA